MVNAAEAKSKPVGVIDALQHGFNLINRHLWLLLLPLVVDVLLWRSPRLSIAPLLNGQLDFILKQSAMPAPLPGETVAMLENFRTVGDSFNLLSLLGGTITGLPSYLARLDAAMVAGAKPMVRELTNFEGVFVYAALLIPLGLLIGSLWLAFVARTMQHEGMTDPAHERSRWMTTLRHAGWIWLNLGLYLAGLTAALLAASGLFGLFMALLLLIAGSGSMAILSLAWLLFVWAVLWVGIGLSFVVSAIAVDGVNVARAVWRSLNVVGRNLPATLGLLFLSLVLTEGFARIWLRLSGNSWGLPIGMVGYAYIGAALTAATLFFYQGRYQHWQRARAAVAGTRRPSNDEFTSQS